MSSSSGPVPDTSAPAGTTTDGPAEVVRSEEQLLVGAEAVEVRRVRVRKQVVTEDVVVQVRREVLVVEDLEPGPDRRGPGVETPLELVLHEEVPVLEVRPVEQVRVDRVRTTEHVKITERLRAERVEVDGVDVDDAVSGAAAR